MRPGSSVLMIQCASHSGCLVDCLADCLPACLAVCGPVCLSVCLFVRPPIRPFALQLVQQLLQGMFNLVDALAALQQAVSIPVQQLSGSWDWMLLHAAGSWAAMLMQAMQLADATAAHVLAPSEQTAQDLLTQVQ